MRADPTDNSMHAFESAGGHPAVYGEWLGDPAAQASWVLGERISPWYKKAPRPRLPKPLWTPSAAEVARATRTPWIRLIAALVLIVAIAAAITTLLR